MIKMIKLDDYFEIKVDNMKPFPKNFIKGDFSSEEAEFISFDNGEKTKMIILMDGNGNQIFSMKDEKYILESDNGFECEYFLSDNLDDLINNFSF
jgi:hypothetical protein